MKNGNQKKMQLCDSPTEEEIQNCMDLLKRTLAINNVPLAVGLAAMLNVLGNHIFSLKSIKDRKYQTKEFIKVLKKFSNMEN